MRSTFSGRKVKVSGLAAGILDEILQRVKRLKSMKDGGVGSAGIN